MKCPVEKRLEVVGSFLKGEISKAKTASLLNVSRRTIENYVNALKNRGREGLVDHRHSNNFKLDADKARAIVDLKKQDNWRSARNIRDKLNIKVSEVAVWKILRKVGLNHTNKEAVKPIQRFEAQNPNDLWQTDIMGRINFPKLGTLYLIATIDDHSRFCLSGRWFRTQGKMNVFQVWYEALSRWGLPKAILQDSGSQYKARTRFGQADYAWYAGLLKIELVYARRAQTKGKIERFWRFVQDDFVREVWQAQSLDEVNGAFRNWLAFYNYKFKSRYNGGVTKASLYKPSRRRVSRTELSSLLTVEERRKVTRESTISLYGKHYFVPPGYIKCRIWVKIMGQKVSFEANGKTFWKTKLRL